MASDTTAPGWYHASGDPADTVRYWDGAQWTTGPTPQPPAASTTTSGFGSAGVTSYASDGPITPPVQRGVWESFVHVLKTQYSDFDGRARRKEYWGFTLVHTTIALLLILPGIFLLSLENSISPIGWIPLGAGILFIIGLTIPSLAIVVRRLHDTDRSGAWYFISFVPYIGGLVLFVLLLLDGTRGANQYGPDTKVR